MIVFPIAEDFNCVKAWTYLKDVYSDEGGPLRIHQLDGYTCTLNYNGGFTVFFGEFDKEKGYALAYLDQRGYGQLEVSSDIPVSLHPFSNGELESRIKEIFWRNVPNY